MRGRERLCRRSRSSSRPATSPTRSAASSSTASSSTTPPTGSRFSWPPTPPTTAPTTSSGSTPGVACGWCARPQRKGKENAQALALGTATGEIVVMTDSATLLEPEALRALVANFSDPSIGAVSSEDVILDAAGNPTAEGVYVKYEMWVRRLETQLPLPGGTERIVLRDPPDALRLLALARWPATSSRRCTPPGAATGRWPILPRAAASSRWPPRTRKRAAKCGRSCGASPCSWRAST